MAKKKQPQKTHAHTHDHNGHSHHHVDPNNHGRAFVIAIILNMIFVSVEFVYGFIANSTALMADAGHNLSDVLGLVLAWGAAILSRRAPSPLYSYGLRSTSILAALANAMILLLACGAISWEAIMRFQQPIEVAGLTVTLVAGIGIIVNGLSAWLFVKGSKVDLNIRGAYLHMMADAVVSLGVVIAGLAMMYTDWYWLDPVVSLLIVVIIAISTWGLLRDSLRLALGAVPAGIDVTEVESYLQKCPGVVDVHDLHIWGISTSEGALSAHLVIPDGYPGDEFMDDIISTLKIRFSIQHSTLQMEQGTTEHICTLHPDASATHQH
ncbi:MAG TPA: cation transporter [Methyloprofundus sp.]|uniref:cation diffusion facilitator family transporter n=1 Tax=Methyloprofundus sp. TaxID=2020875 RepID=UPI0017A2CB03|nr:cation diffusion facilitator family transporter [Methyloprofundus sp.]HIG65958.1 cation transporter [Methyloprofundus sp.]HIL78580.1 cation transporter [Methylococcales bacterium]